MGKALRNANPKDPLAYLLPRVGAALELDEIPPSQNGRTFIPAISALELQELKSLLREQSWDALLSGAEGAAANRPLSFDLQRLVHTALRQLGDGYNACRLVVEAELAALLQRLPGVLELAHGNGTPFADADTQAWIRAEILAGSGGGGGARLRAPATSSTTKRSPPRARWRWPETPAKRWSRSTPCCTARAAAARASASGWRWRAPCSRRAMRSSHPACFQRSTTRSSAAAWTSGSPSLRPIAWPATTNA